MQMIACSCVACSHSACVSRAPRPLQVAVHRPTSHPHSLWYRCEVMDLDHATKVRRTFHQPVYIATAAPSTIPTTTPSSCRLGTHIARWASYVSVNPKSTFAVLFATSSVKVCVVLKQSGCKLLAPLQSSNAFCVSSHSKHLRLRTLMADSRCAFLPAE